MQAVLPRHLRPHREKIFGPAPEHRLDGNAKARVWAAAAAYNSANRVPRQHQGPLTWATLRVLRVLLWRFHGADGGGRCFPSYEKTAAAAQCCRDSVTARESCKRSLPRHRLCGLNSPQLLSDESTAARPAPNCRRQSAPR